MRIRSVFNCLGWTLLILTIAMGINSFAGIIFGEFGEAWIFIQSTALTGFVGGALVLSTRGEGAAFGRQESYVFVVLVWPVLALLSALPLFLAEPSLGGFDSIFEAISGLTTTGATMLALPEEASQTVLLWRALMQWLGGYISIVLVVVILTHLNIGGLEIFQNIIPAGEGESLTERLAQTAKDLSPVYGLITLACVAALMLSGMSGFDALCHALSTISTGGFSTRTNGIVSFGGTWIEISLIVFMLLGSMNFTLHWGLLHGRWRIYGRNREVRYALITIIFATTLAVIYATSNNDVGMISNIRHSIFVVVSMTSTTGYFSVPDVTSFGIPVILLGIFATVGAATGSTGGGIKLLRVAILLKQAIRELRRLSHPHGIVSVKFGRQRLSENAIGSVWSYFFVFILVLAAATMLISLSGVDPVSAMTASLAALINAGPVLTIVDAGGYSNLPISSQVILCFAMILGRVEMLALFTLMNPSYWKN